MAIVSQTISNRHDFFLTPTGKSHRYGSRRRMIFLTSYLIFNHEEMTTSGPLVDRAACSVLAAVDVSEARAPAGKK